MILSVLQYCGGESMNLNDDIKNKINFYYNNPEEYDFVSTILMNREEIKGFLYPTLPNQIDRKQRKDRVLMMKIVYSLQKLAKKNELMAIGKSELTMPQRMFHNGARLFHLSSEVILAVLVSFLIGAIFMIYVNIYFGIVLLPVLGYSAFYFTKNYVIEQMDKKVLSFGSELVKQDKNRYL